ncbi:lipid A deacylase LpxR family protein [Vibrio sp.]|uniref:lipid A deacylase LpxR family protein n=1 Tax=Vibrio sp. TaxID=678 RepID=UPI003D0A9162
MHWVLLTLGLFYSASILASESPTLTVALDNDGAFGVDQDYTHGLFFSYSSGRLSKDWHQQPLSLSYWQIDSVDKINITIGQQMWTPADIESNQPQADDRPYAGLMFAEFNYYSTSPDLSHRFGLMAGTTGENSFARSTQKLAHTVLDTTQPNGWEYQIENKWVGNLSYANQIKLWRQTTPALERAELSALSEINMGNFRRDISAGLMLRWGQDLANSFGSASVNAERTFRPGMLGQGTQAWFLFSGISVRYRFYDLTIEGLRPGLTVPQNYAVDVKNQQATFTLGLAWYRPHFAASITASAYSAEYSPSRQSVYGVAGMTISSFF